MIIGISIMDYSANYFLHKSVECCSVSLLVGDDTKNLLNNQNETVHSRSYLGSNNKSDLFNLHHKNELRACDLVKNFQLQYHWAFPV